MHEAAALSISATARNVSTRVSALTAAASAASAASKAERTAKQSEAAEKESDASGSGGGGGGGAGGAGGAGGSSEGGEAAMVAVRAGVWLAASLSLGLLLLLVGSCVRGVGPGALLSSARGVKLHSVGFYENLDGLIGSSCHD